MNPHENMNHFCQVCRTSDPELKHVRAFFNWFPKNDDTPRIVLCNPEEKENYGVVLCSGCICCIAAKAMEQEFIVGARE